MASVTKSSIDKQSELDSILNKYEIEYTQEISKYQNENTIENLNKQMEVTQVYRKNLYDLANSSDGNPDAQIRYKKTGDNEIDKRLKEIQSLKENDPSLSFIRVTMLASNPVQYKIVKSEESIVEEAFREKFNGINEKFENPEQIKIKIEVESLKKQFEKLNVHDFELNKLHDEIRAKKLTTENFRLLTEITSKRRTIADLVGKIRLQLVMLGPGFLINSELDKIKNKAGIDYNNNNKTEGSKNRTIDFLERQMHILTIYNEQLLDLADNVENGELGSNLNENEKQLWIKSILLHQPKKKIFEKSNELIVVRYLNTKANPRSSLEPKAVVSPEIPKKVNSDTPKKQPSTPKKTVQNKYIPIQKRDLTETPQTPKVEETSFLSILALAFRRLFLPIFLPSYSYNY